MIFEPSNSGKLQKSTSYAMFLLTCKIPPFKPMPKFLGGGLEGSRNKEQKCVKNCRTSAQAIRATFICPLAELT